MAYFPNGSSGENFDAQCWECLHDDEEQEILCPVAAVLDEKCKAWGEEANPERGR